MFHSFVKSMIVYIIIYTGYSGNKCLSEGDSRIGRGEQKLSGNKDSTIVTMYEPEHIYGIKTKWL